MGNEQSFYANRMNRLKHQNEFKLDIILPIYDESF